MFMSSLHKKQTKKNCRELIKMILLSFKCLKNIFFVYFQNVVTKCLDNFETLCP